MNFSALTLKDELTQSNLEGAILIHFNHSDLSSDVKFKCQVSGEGFETLHYKAPFMV